MYRAIETPSESNYDVRSEEIVRSYCVGRNSAGGGARPAGNETSGTNPRSSQPSAPPSLRLGSIGGALLLLDESR